MIRTTTKQRSTCKGLKDMTGFGRDASRADGRERKCLACIEVKSAAAHRRRRGALGAVYQRRGRKEMICNNVTFLSNVPSGMTIRQS